MKAFSKTRLRQIAILTCASFILMAPVSAAEIQPKNIETSNTIVMSPQIEGAGLLVSAADGSLGFDLWKNSDRKDITDLLQKMPANAHNPHIQKLIYGVLLSKADPSLMKSTDGIEEGKDFLTLRLNKLIEGGAYKQALDLYTSLGIENPPASVARAAITAMLFRGEKSLACLELNTIKDEHANIDFFRTMSAYCDATLSKQASSAFLQILNNAPEKLLPVLAARKNFSFPYSSTALDQLSQLERAALVAEGKLVLPENLERSFRNVPPSHLQILMINPALSAEDKFVLHLRALEWGLITTDGYKRQLISVIDLDARKDPALSVPATAPAFEKLAYLLQISINRKIDSEKWPLIREAFFTAKPYGLAALLPFADILQKLSPENLTFYDLETSVKVINRAGYPISPLWAAYILNFRPQPQDQSAHEALKKVVQGIDITTNIELFGPIYSNQKPDNAQADNFNVIENIDNSPTLDHTADKVYENNLSLTKNSDYVMPTTGIQNRLLEASKQGYIGETVLLITVALRDHNPWDINPELLRKATQSLSSVGLTEISEALRAAAALGGSKDL